MKNPINHEHAMNLMERLQSSPKFITLVQEQDEDEIQNLLQEWDDRLAERIAA
jgi:hypothetical protein